MAVSTAPADLVRPVLVAVTVSGWAVVVIPDVVAIVSSDVPLPPATTAGVNVQAASDGPSPVRDRATSPVKPLTGDTCTAKDTVSPARTLADEGATVSAKSGSGGGGGGSAW